LLRKLRQRSYAFIDGKGDPASDGAAAMLFEIIRNFSEVAVCGSVQRIRISQDAAGLCVFRLRRAQ
jgi:hypothetical protein